MFVEVNGTRLFFDVEGAGLDHVGREVRERPTIIMLHGGPGADHAHYRPAFSSLSEYAQVIYYDHRGNGRSDPSRPEEWNLAQWGDDVRGFCDALGIERPIILGTSFGGFVAQSYITRHPGHAAKAVLISTAAKMDFEEVFAAFRRLGGEEAGEAARAYWTEPTTERRARYRDICLPLYTRREGMPDWAFRAIMRDEVAIWFNGPGNEHGQMDFRADLADVTCPVLVMGGEDDPITPISFSETIAECLPPARVKFERFAQAGHGVIADQPDRMLKVLEAFVLGGSTHA